MLCECVQALTKKIGVRTHESQPKAAEVSKKQKHMAAAQVNNNAMRKGTKILIKCQ